MNSLKSLDQLQELIDIGYEINFTLNGKGWLIEPDQNAAEFSEKRVIVSTEPDNYNFIKKFQNTAELLNYRLNGKAIKDQWKEINNIEY